MERMDVAIVLVGAAVLAVAIAGVALTGAGPEGAEYAVSVSTRETALGSGSRDHAPGETIRDQFPFEAPNATLARLQAEATVTLGPGAMNVQASLKAPNGTTHAPAPPSSSGGFPTGAVTFRFDVPLLPPPANATLVAASEADALVRANATPPANASWAGTWTLEVQVASGTPLPLGPITVSWKAAATEWEAKAAPAPPTGGR